MGRIIAITSGKGGVGKTTVTAGLAGALAERGCRVVAVDGDFGLRNLDLVLGLESSVVYDISDVLSGRCEPEKALASCRELPGLYFLAAPQRLLPGEENRQRRGELMRALSKEFDYVLVDSPAGVGEGFLAACEGADMGLVVTTLDPSALRDAEQAATLMRELGVSDLRLIVNRFNPRYILEGLAPDLDGIIDSVAVRLIGVIPDDKKVFMCQSRGESLVRKGGKKLSRSFLDIADRLMGKNLPLRGL